MNFETFLRQAFTYFGKGSTPPPKETGLLWASECGKYPDEFFDWAYQYLKAGNGKLFLENPPREVCALWKRWLQANPRKVDRTESACAEDRCDQGYLHAYPPGSQTLTPFCFRCGTCRSQVGPMPAVTVADLEAKGWVLDSLGETRRRFEAAKSKWQNRNGNGGLNYGKVARDMIGGD